MNELAALRDVHPPPAPAWWAVPPWAFAAALLVLLALLLAARRYRQRRGLRAALHELAALEASHARDRDATLLVRGVSRLLRRYAIARFPEDHMAGLTGGAWLRFLDEHGGNGDFCGGAGAVLESQPYQRHAMVDAAPLLALARRWLQANPQ
jgi:hypothetical protein